MRPAPHLRDQEDTSRRPHSSSRSSSCSRPSSRSAFWRRSGFIPRSRPGSRQQGSHSRASNVRVIMPTATQSIIDTRRHQMFPTLEAAEIERVRRFGKVRAYKARRGACQSRPSGSRPDHHLGRQGRHNPARRIGPPHADRHSRRQAHSWASWRNWRAAQRWSTPTRRERWRRCPSRRTSCGHC